MTRRPGSAVMRRRQLLRAFGVGGGALALASVSERLVREARGNVTRPVRLVIFEDQQGWDSNRFDAAAEDLRQVPLNAAMQPLEPFKDRLLLLSNFYNPFNVGLHGNGYATWTMRGSTLVKPDAVDSSERYPEKEGIDWYEAIAPHLRGSAVYDLRRVTLDTNPHELYTETFGDFDPSTREAVRRTLGKQRSRLDFIKDDVKRLESRLAGAEREKLEQYLASIETLDSSLDRRLSSEPPACTPPLAPSRSLPAEHKKYAPIDEARARALFELGAESLVCGLTNVAFFSLVPGRGNFDFLGNPLDKHNTQHESFKAGETGLSAKKALGDIDRWYSGYLGELLQRLSEFREGDGTMLDHTLVLWLNNGGGRHHTSATSALGNRDGTDHYPIAVWGNPLGKLKRQGAFLKYPTLQHSMSDVFVTLSHALGVPLDTFGDPAHFHGVLGDLV